MTIVDTLLDGSFMPHGHCFLWQENLLFLHVVGDLTIALAYIIIPIILVRLVIIRKDLKFNSLFLLFAAFILFCGLTHVIGVINIWHGYYYVAGVAKVITGAISITTAIVLWKLLPVLVKLPSRIDMKDKMTELQLAKEALIESNASLEAKVAERTQELERIAYRDSLTNLLNRREITRILDIEIERAQRQKTPLSVLMLDLDNFKSINDSFGHQVGDSVLKSSADTLMECGRRTDYIGRIGGEEFVVLLPNTGYKVALELAERYRASIASTRSNDIQFTCSIGVAELEVGEQMEKLMQRVDQALYAAKNSGRNTVK
ncbi:Diguanylate cyclase DgcM [Halioglobus japonicus]|nr:Diguanylate cyclase DgcM [Halioglobus japonicus]